MKATAASNCKRAFTAIVVIAGWTTLASAQHDLIGAVRSGESERVEALVAQGANVNASSADGTTPLHWAAGLDDRAIARVLLAAGAMPDAANRYGMTPLHLAVENASLDLARWLLDAGADPNHTLPEGETVLMTAARTGDPEVLELLLDRGATVDARESWQGETALMWAAAGDHADAVRVLVEHGADIDARSTLHEFERRRQGQSVLPLGDWTALMIAAREDARGAGRTLLDTGADPDIADPDGATALAIAVINGNWEFGRLLLESGADPNLVDTSGMGPLYAAVDMHTLATGHGRPNPPAEVLARAPGMVEALLAHGADPNARLSGTIIQRQHTGGDGLLGEGATPLLRAAKSGDFELVRMLAAAGGDPLAVMPNMTTALMFAAGLGWRNGSPAAPSYDQGTEEGAIQTIDFLLEHGVELNAAKENGDTALHVAVSGRGSEAIMRHLLERGADASIQNGRQQTPGDIARSRTSPLAEWFGDAIEENDER